MVSGEAVPTRLALSQLLGQEGRHHRQRRRAAAADGLLDKILPAGAPRGYTALDTAGQPFQPDDPAYLAAFDTLMASTSLVILDLKEIDPEKHRQLTGRDNANILAHGTPHL